MKDNNFCVLLILDGFGETDKVKGNAIKQAGTPYLNSLKAKYPFTTLDASGEAVGVIKGQMGDSEVGHMNIGAGRIMYQHLLTINKDIANGSFFRNPSILKLMGQVKKNNSALHLISIITDGGVHGHYKHLLAYLYMAKQQGIKNVYIHAITDGRDTDPESSPKYLKIIDAYTKKIQLGQIASVSGRFWAMDRDHNYDRTQKYYDTIIWGKAKTERDALKYVKSCYKKGVTDEFLEPVLIAGKDGKVHTIGTADGIIDVNYRKDRQMQLLEALAVGNFDKFETKKLNNNLILTTAEISPKFDVLVAYSDVIPANTLSEVISKNKFKQLKIAETQKYAHVTYYLNCTVEKPFAGEDRKLFDSDKIANFAEKPLMQAEKITDYAVKAIEGKKYKLIAINIANGDMVGHTGDFKAALIAVKEIDKCVKSIAEACLKAGGTCIVTADHGNIDEMLTKFGKISTAHSLNKVPFIIVNDKLIGTALKNGGKLADIAPTILKILDIKQPKEMTGQSLF